MQYLHWDVSIPDESLFMPHRPINYWGLKEHGGDMAIGAYGIVNRIVFLFVMIIMGFNQGMQPIAGYNFGADNSTV